TLNFYFKINTRLVWHTYSGITGGSCFAGLVHVNDTLVLRAAVNQRQISQLFIISSVDQQVEQAQKLDRKGAGGFRREAGGRARTEA
ncbi:MAG: hypothetical protein IJH73_05600, partial [Lachnospiraceae bacterium]|nr:hypothetical protein [Lachnospiraceae bacterium]